MQEGDTDPRTGFIIGEMVVKHTGEYNPPGIYRGSILTRAGKVRVIVEHDYGMLHIYALEQIKSK